MTFTDYLNKQGFSTSTITYHTTRYQYFTTWYQNHKTSIYTSISYESVLDYILHLKKRKLQPQSINLHLSTLKKYYDYLVFIEEITSNPIEDMSLKGVMKKVYLQLLDTEQLNALYHNYPIENYNPNTNNRSKLCNKRNKVLVGFMVYQGLTTTQIKNIEIHHLDLYKAKIYIPETKRSNSRTLTLQSWQVLDLVYYLETIHPILQPKEYDIYLFTPTLSLNSSLLKVIFPTLQNIHPLAASNYMIRASVITNWLGQYPIRKVQYMAGHKYISSTEKYRQDDLKNLQEAIENLHPIR